MRTFKLFALLTILTGIVSSAYAGGNTYTGQEDPNKKVIKSGLLGAATGAIASEASGGEAGKGALIGAGTNVIGGALLDTLTAPSAPAPQPVYYQQPQGYGAPQYQQQQGYYDQRQQPAYYAPPAYAPEDPNKKILKSGLLGAGTGALASSMSGGDAGKGALIGAGTNVVGGALLDMLSGPSQPAPQPVYYQQPPQQQYYQQQPPQYQQQQYSQPQKKIIRKYDAEGNIVSEEEVYQ